MFTYFNLFEELSFLNMYVIRDVVHLKTRAVASAGTDSGAWQTRIVA